MKDVASCKTPLFDISVESQCAIALGNAKKGRNFVRIL